MSELALESTGLGKRFGSRWALRDCSLNVPEGRICGLIGANGAGKTTLLRMLVGLSRPSAGEVEIFGQPPSDTEPFVRDVGFLAQEIPLYRRWTVADHLTFGARLNPGWDDDATRERLDRFRIPFEQRVGTLSGGQRAQVALALALGKRPRLLLLDEPVAALDPLARRQFLATLTAAVADGNLTVILSSHLVTDLERVCDHVVVLNAAQLVVEGGLDQMLASHYLLTGPSRDLGALERDHTVLRTERFPRQVKVWVRLNGPLHDPTWEVTELDLEEIVLAYMGQSSPAPAVAKVAS
jgi:ABC-2 type transport system ATP-binding protein